MKTRYDWLPALAAFEAAARYQNFAHAARALNLTAGAVGHHVRRLEERLGVPLFVRQARGVLLTLAGRQLADAASNMLEDVESVIHVLRAGHQRRARVHINTLHSFAHAWLIPRLADFHARHPDVQVLLDTEASLVRFTGDDGPDLAIRHGPGAWNGLVAHPLLEETLFPAAAVAHPGADRLCSAEALAEVGLIADRSRQGWREWFREQGLPQAAIDERFIFNDTTDALEAAAHGLGVVLARGVIAQPWLAAGRLMRLPLPELPGRWSYHAVYPAGQRLSAPAQAFLQWLQAQCALEERQA